MFNYVMKTKKDRFQEEKKVNNFVKELRKLLSKYGAYIEMKTIPTESLSINFYDLSVALDIDKINESFDTIDSETIFDQFWFNSEFEDE